MAMVPKTPKIYKPVAFYATLFLHNVGTTGMALRDGEGHVYFQAESTGVWTELADTDAPDLHLHGRYDLVATTHPLRERA
jgi:hypothetical protein